MVVFHVSTFILQLQFLGVLIHVDHKPLINITTAVQRVNWGLIVFLGAIFAMSDIFTSPEMGISVWIKSWLTPLIGDWPLMLIVLLAVIIAIFVTNVGSNALVIVIVNSVFLPIMAASGASAAQLISFGILIILSAQTAFITASGSTATAMVLGNPESGITVGNTVKNNLIVMVIMCLLAWLVFWPIATLFF